MRVHGRERTRTPKRRRAQKRIHTIPCLYAHLHNVGVRGSEISPDQNSLWFLQHAGSERLRARRRENGASILMARALYSAGLNRTLHRRCNLRQPPDRFAATRKTSSGRAENKRGFKSLLRRRAGEAGEAPHFQVLTRPALVCAGPSGLPGLSATIPTVESGSHGLSATQGRNKDVVGEGLFPPQHASQA